VSDTQPSATPPAAPTTRALVERGAAARLGEFLDELGAQRIALLRDPTAWNSSAAADLLAPALAARQVTIVDDFDALPTIEAVDWTAARIQRAACTAVVAVGGGTALDTAKAAALVAAAGGPARAILATLPPAAVRPLPLVAIPTTAGTGAEATRFAVVYVDGHKHSLDDPRLRPRIALVDAALCDALPPAITAATGLDALCQAAESLWAVGSTAASRSDAAVGLRLAVEHLVDAVRRPTASARDGMSRAAHLSGRAIDVSRTTAAHALSYTLTSDFGIPHGHAVALFFGPVLEDLGALTAADCADPRGIEFVRRRLAEVCGVLGCSEPRDARRAFEELVGRCGLETRLAGLGIRTAAERARLVEGVNPARLANHPRRLDRDRIAGLVASIAGSEPGPAQPPNQRAT
jgi:alcohol dehydrogenase class IV